MLKEFGPDVWIADGPEVAVAGFRYPTRMAVIRLADASLFVWSPIALSDGLRAAANALGRVAHIVAPNTLHHLFLADWKRAYPDAKLYAPPGLRRKRADLVFDADLGDGEHEWSHEIGHVVMHGNLITEEVVFFHRGSGTVLFADLLQQIPVGALSGWRAIVAKLDLMTGAMPAVPRKFRLAFTRRRAARNALAKVLAWPAEKVVMAHGTPVETNARSFIRQAFFWLG